MAKKARSKKGNAGSGGRYVARPNSPFSDADARKIARVCNSMEKRGIHVSPRTFLAEAQEPGSPVHGLSVWGGWDRDVAVERHWLDCASRCIGSVYWMEFKESRPQRVRYSIVSTNGNGKAERMYRKRELILAEDSERMQLSDQLFRRATQAIEEAADLGFDVAETRWKRLCRAV